MKHGYCKAALLLGLSALSSVQVQAQPPAAADPTVVGIVAEPCLQVPPMPAAAQALLTELFMEPRTLVPEDFASLMGNEEFAQYNRMRRSAGADWPSLCRFSAANKAVLASGTQPAVVFMGDSITENWLLGDPVFFGTEHVNRGISAQTTPQMLLRFRADVIALQPSVVHILAGTNDVAGNTGPTTVQDIKNNVMSMTELARANNIAVILGSIPPAATFNWQPTLDPKPRISELNAWMQQYAQANQLVYIDYFSALAGPNGELRAELGNDGVHPNRDGYRIMRQLFEAALAGMKQ